MFCGQHRSHPTWWRSCTPALIAVALVCSFYLFFAGAVSNASAAQSGIPTYTAKQYAAVYESLDDKKPAKVNGLPRPSSEKPKHRQILYWRTHPEVRAQYTACNRLSANEYAFATIIPKYGKIGKVNLTREMGTTVFIETGGTLDERAVGDSGGSFGWFQMNVNGRLASTGLSPEQAMNPKLATRVSAPEFFNIAYHTGMRGPALAYAAQRPSSRSNYFVKYWLYEPAAVRLLSLGCQRFVRQ